MSESYTIYFIYRPQEYEYYTSKEVGIESGLSGAEGTPVVASVKETWANKYIKLSWPTVTEELKESLDKIEYFRYYSFYDGEYTPEGYYRTVYCIKKDIRIRYTTDKGKIIYSAEVILKWVT